MYTSVLMNVLVDSKKVPQTAKACPKAIIHPARVERKRAYRYIILDVETMFYVLFWSLHQYLSVFPRSRI
ncbi:hypothetical protein EYZ11_001952 [Aspergillus tanneri]|uniref:Uncharacterized protein n=1 Tax=Aspergillus tanneri TaxID=1220188 RepID=A0A4S3JSU6_9EURO|nr:hypothetical protein EYZ11_001952 [Aspergillus tanneri]